MAIYKIFPSKDSSLYTISQSMNTGLDEILEASTALSVNPDFVTFVSAILYLSYYL